MGSHSHTDELTTHRLAIRRIFRRFEDGNHVTSIQSRNFPTLSIAANSKQRVSSHECSNVPDFRASAVCPTKSLFSTIDMYEYYSVVPAVYTSMFLISQVS
jgi:hypothetical protein